MEKYSNKVLDQITNSMKVGQIPSSCYFYSLKNLNRVNPLRYELLKETKELFPQYHAMSVSLDQGEHMKTILRLMNAKKGIEVGVFTGSSAFAFAEVIPEDGQLVCLDVSKEFTDLAQKYWKLAGLDHKIQLHIGPGVDKLDELLEDENNHNSYDFAFIDADKDNYINYYERVLKLVRPNGLIMMDNMLYQGLVDKEYAELESQQNAYHIKKTGLKLSEDERVHISTINISDGVMFCTKK